MKIGLLSGVVSIQLQWVCLQRFWAKVHNTAGADSVGDSSADMATGACVYEVIVGALSNLRPRKAQPSSHSDAQLARFEVTTSPVLWYTLSTFGPPFAQEKSEKPGPKKPLSGHGPEKADHSRTIPLHVLIWYMVHPFRYGPTTLGGPPL
eukprot:215301-Prymnesium_polylepis.1